MIGMAPLGDENCLGSVVAARSHCVDSLGELCLEVRDLKILKPRIPW